MRPPSSANGLSSVSRLPVNSLWASIGTPATMLANATPHRSAGRKLPNAITLSHRLRQAASPRLLRYSMPMPRTISATRIRNRAR